MKKILFTLLGIVFASSMIAQSADDVILKYAANIGGLEAFNNLTSAKITGTITMQGNDMPFTTQVLNGKGMRMDIDAMGQSITNSYYNGKGWKINPLGGSAKALEVSGTELAGLKPQASMANDLMDYKARGHQVELQGEESVDGTKAFKIKLINKSDGKPTTYFIRTTDYTLIKSISNREIQGQEMEIETYYSDIREFNGLKFFMSKVQKIGGQEFQTIKYSSVELNVPINESIFAMPK